MTCHRSIITLLLTALWLNGCGGGGGGSGETASTNTTPNTNPAQVTVTEQLAGVVMDGYLQNAFVFADLNENYQYDGNEPSVFTDADGKYTLNVALDHRDATVIARAISGTTIDLDYPGTPIQADYQMLSAKGANHIVSPISTWVHAVQREENAQLGTAEAIVAEQLGLDQLGQSSVLIDYVAEPTAHAKALHNHAKISASALAEHHNASSLIDTVSNAANAYVTLLQDNTVKQTLNQGQVVAEDMLISIVEKVAPTRATAIKAQITQQAPSAINGNDAGDTDASDSGSNSTDSGNTDSDSTGSDNTGSGSADSGSTDSGVTDSGSTGSDSSDSGSTEPGNTGSGSTDSGSTSSGGNDSGSTDSGSTDSGSTGSDSSNSGSTGSGSTDSGSTNSGSTDSDNTGSGSTGSDSTDSGSTDSGSTGSGSTDSGSTDSGSTDSGNTGSDSSDSGSTGSGSSDSGNTDSGNTGSGSTDSGSTATGTFSMTSSTQQSLASGIISLSISHTDSTADLSGAIWSVQGLSEDNYQWTIVNTTSRELRLTAPERITTSQNVTVRAQLGNQAATSSVTFKPSFQYTQPTQPIALQHRHGSTPTFGSGVIWIYPTRVVSNGDGTESATLYGFDQNGFLSEKLNLSVPEGVLSKYDISFPFSSRTSLDGQKRYMAFVAPIINDADNVRVPEHEDVLWVAYDRATDTAEYAEFVVPPAHLKPGQWRYAHYGEYFVLFRPVFSQWAAPNTDNYRIDIQAIKISYEGQLLASQVFETAIENVGYPYGYMRYKYAPGYLGMAKHYNDLLINNIGNWERDPAFAKISVFQQNIWLVIDTETMTLKAPIWLEANKFKRSRYDEMPSLGLRMDYDYGPDIAFTPKAWNTFGSFNSINDDYLVADPSDRDFTEGGLDLTLAQDYQSAELKSWGHLDLDTVQQTYEWQYQRTAQIYEVTRNDMGTTRQVQTRYKGNADMLYQAPVLDGAKHPTCSFYGAPYANIAKWQDGDCTKFQHYYGYKDNTIRMRDLLPEVYDNWEPNYFFNVERNPDYGVEGSLTFLPHDSSTKIGQLYLMLDEQWHHPGCTVDIPYTPPQQPLLWRDEQVQVHREAIPNQADISVQVIRGQAEISVSPYQYRAPILCSDYKISLDQELTLYGNTAHSPTLRYANAVLHANYTATLDQGPANGQFDLETFRYTPDAGFVGNDRVKLLLDDTTGTQLVTLDFTVLAPP